jgi:drug/metabolite transporter (DMT)-like permease
VCFPIYCISESLFSPHSISLTLSTAQAQLSMALIGPMFKFLSSQGISGLLAASWRSQLMALLLLIPALVEYQRLSAVDRAKLTMMQPIHSLADTKAVGCCEKAPLILWVVCCGSTWGVAVVCWILGLRYISTTNASLLVNSTPIWMAVYLHLSRRCRLSVVEWAGVLVAFVGMGLSSIDSAGEGGEEQEDDIPPMLVALAVFLCLGSAVVYVFDTLIAKRVRVQVPIMLYGCLTSQVIAVWTGVGSALFEEGIRFTTDRDGLFGLCV